jgi:two-component sensor histidine kinase
MQKQLLLFILLILLLRQSGAQELTEKEAHQITGRLATLPDDTVKVRLLVQLGYYYTMKPGELKADLDSSLLLIRKAEILSHKLGDRYGQNECLLRLAILLREKNEREQGKALTDSSIRLGKKWNQPYLLGEAYMERAQYYDPMVREEIPEILNCYQQALTAFRLAGNIERQGFCLKNMANLHSIQGEMLKCFTEAREALALYQSIGYTKMQGVYDMLSIYYTSITDWPSAIRYRLMSVQTAENLKDTTIQMCSLYNRLGVALFKAKKTDEALVYFQKAMVVAEKYQDINSLFTVAFNTANCFNIAGTPDKGLVFAQHFISKHPAPKDNEFLKLVTNCMFLTMLNKMGDNRRAQPYCDSMFSIYKRSSVVEDFGRLQVAQFLIDTRQFNKAEESLLVHNASLVKSSDPALYLLNRQNWYRLDSARGNYKAAMKALKQYNQVQDSVFNLSQSRIFETIQVEYDIEQKNKDLQLKSKSIEALQFQAALQKQEISKTRLIRNITIVGVILLFVFLALLYQQYRIRIRASKEVEKKNGELEQLVDEKEWLLKEIHHRVKNNLQTVVSLLESQSAYLQNKEALLALQDSQNRIYSMSLIHQLLYQDENVASIKMDTYLPQLVRYLRDSFPLGAQIRFKLEVTPFHLDVSQAVPVGLILNEAITNSIKYAFDVPSNDDMITVRVAKNDNQMVLEITDNGKGLPAGFNAATCSGLGMRLMRGLAGDLGGQFSVRSEMGTVICVSFVANEPLSGK